MRINLYSQELILDDDLSADIAIQPVGNRISNTNRVYGAVRMYLHSSDRLHDTEDDDDRSAITFWLPRSQEKRERLAQQFELMAKEVRLAPQEDEDESHVHSFLDDAEGRLTSFQRDGIRALDDNLVKSDVLHVTTLDGSKHDVECPPYCVPATDYEDFQPLEFTEIGGVEEIGVDKDE